MEVNCQLLHCMLHIYVDCMVRYYVKLVYLVSWYQPYGTWYVLYEIMMYHSMIDDANENSNRIVHMGSIVCMVPGTRYWVKQYSWYHGSWLCTSTVWHYVGPLSHSTLDDENDNSIRIQSYVTYRLYGTWYQILGKAVSGTMVPGTELMVHHRVQSYVTTLRVYMTAYLILCVHIVLWNIYNAAEAFGFW